MLISTVLQVCTPESKEECTTTYEEKCTVTYAYGKQCEKIPKKHCKYVQVRKTQWLCKILELCNFCCCRFQDVRKPLTRSVKRVMRINARKLLRRLERRWPSTGAPGLREPSQMTHGAEHSYTLFVVIIGHLLLLLCKFLYWLLNKFFVNPNYPKGGEHYHPLSPETNLH